MKIKLGLIFIFILFSCVYDPPQEGKEILIHNQTNKPIIIYDSLSGNHLHFYDTAFVNGKEYISRKPNYMAEYGIYQKFYADIEMNNLKSKKINKITLYIIDPINLQSAMSQISINKSLRSFDINIDTLKKYKLNHLFITNDTMFIEHEYNYYTNMKQ